MMTGASLMLIVTLAQAVVPGVPGAPGTSPAGANPKGSAVVKGQITAADTGKPLRRARITVTGEPLATPKSTSTNVRGEYEIKELPAGRYQVRVQRSGYLPMLHGQRRSTEPGRPLDVAEGQVLEKLDFALPRAAVISGRVIDETGEPVAGVSVWAMRQEYFRGRRRVVPAGAQATTDDTGQYRLLSVSPGQYLLMAMLRETWKALRPGSGQAGPELQTFGYARTFFPGTARTADATHVKVAAGQEVASIDFALVAARAGAISGTATGPDGAPLAGARVSFSIELTGPQSSMFMGVTSVTVGADGSWRIPDIAPGEYRVEVSTADRNRAPARASRIVQLQGGDVEGVALAADYGGTITGEVLTDTGEALPSSADQMRVAAESLTPDARPMAFVTGDLNGVVGSDGRFRTSGVLSPSIVRVLSLPKGWALKGVEGGEVDHAEFPVELRGGRTLDVRVVITNRFPEVTGRITDDRENPAEGTVLLFPSDSERWFDTGVLKMARPDQSGVFRMETVRPGEYLAVALEAVESWQINDPEFLEEVKSRATRVTVREAQPEMLTLKVAR